MLSAFAVAIFLAMLAASAAMPSMLVVVGERRGKAHAWILLVGLIGLAAMTGGPATAAWMTAFIGAPAMGLAYGRRTGKSVESIFLIAFGASVAGFILVAMATSMGTGFGAEQLDILVTATRVERPGVFLRSGLIDPVLLEQLASLPAEVRIDPGLFLGFLIYIPGVYLVLASLIVWLNMITVSRFNPSVGISGGATEFENWSAPESWVFLVVAPGLILALSGNPWAEAIAGNILIVSIMPFFFQGMAITRFAMDRFQLSPGMRIIGYALLLGLLDVMMFIPAVAMVGIMDIWLDFRRLKKPTSATKDESAKEDKGDQT